MLRVRVRTGVLYDELNHWKTSRNSCYCDAGRRQDKRGHARAAIASDAELAPPITRRREILLPQLDDVQPRLIVENQEAQQVLYWMPILAGMKLPGSAAWGHLAFERPDIGTEAIWKARKEHSHPVRHGIRQVHIPRGVDETAQPLWARREHARWPEECRLRNRNVDDTSPSFAHVMNPPTIRSTTLRPIGSPRGPRERESAGANGRPVGHRLEVELARRAESGVGGDHIPRARPGN